VKFTQVGEVLLSARTDSVPPHGVRLTVNVTDSGIGISGPGNATPVPSGTGNAALAALAVRPWHLPAHRRTQSTR